MKEAIEFHIDGLKQEGLAVSAIHEISIVEVTANA